MMMIYLWMRKKLNVMPRRGNLAAGITRHEDLVAVAVPVIGMSVRTKLLPSRVVHPWLHPDLQSTLKCLPRQGLWMLRCNAKLDQLIELWTGIIFYVQILKMLHLLELEINRQCFFSYLVFPYFYLIFLPVPRYKYKYKNRAGTKLSSTIQIFISEQK